jgi:hypothetical protein
MVGASLVEGMAEGWVAADSVAPRAVRVRRAKAVSSLPVVQVEGAAMVGARWVVAMAAAGRAPVGVAVVALAGEGWEALGAAVEVAKVA